MGNRFEAAPSWLDVRVHNKPGALPVTPLDFGTIEWSAEGAASIATMSEYKNRGAS